MSKNGKNGELSVLARDINDEHDACLLSAADAVTHAINAGRMLIQAKAGLKHGEFMPWVTEHCRFAGSTARKYMRVANCYGHSNLELPGSLEKALRAIAEEKELFKDWSDSEVERMELVEGGQTVLANLHDESDAHLIAWATERSLYVKIDRNTPWGNPYLLDEDGDRETVCDSYTVYFGLKYSLHGRLEELRGKVLGCWCYPERCHGNVLIEQLEGASNEAQKVGCHR